MSTAVAFDRITADRTAWPRLALDAERVEDFVELYRDGGLAALPPLAVIDRGADYLLADGWHRHEALRRLEIVEVPVELVSANGRDGLAVAYEIGLRTAATVSKALNRAEKQAAVLRLTVAGGRTDAEIADLVGVARTTVGRIRDRQSAMHTSPATPTTGRYPATADELAERLVRDLGRMWAGRGITDMARDRLARNLASALRRQFGDDEALVWARRLAAWTTDAVSRLERDAVGR
ncbi:MAG TPA: hypothetical protein VKR30_04800 [Candidatus Limnocylindrales bacterium]|nr:hypothetical protein [Candidatus Limnocylindrales bacterium]